MNREELYTCIFAMLVLSALAVVIVNQPYKCNQGTLENDMCVLPMEHVEREFCVNLNAYYDTNLLHEFYPDGATYLTPNGCIISRLIFSNITMDIDRDLLEKIKVTTYEPDRKLSVYLPIFVTNESLIMSTIKVCGNISYNAQWQRNIWDDESSSGAGCKQEIIRAGGEHK